MSVDARGPARAVPAAASGWWVAGLVFLVTGFPAAVLSGPALVASFTDDTFYYLGIARHVASGHGFTFDGLHPTNGFQPLWQLLLVPVFWVVPGDVAPLRCVVLMQAALLAAAAAGLWAILRRGLSPATAAAAPLLLIALPGGRLLWIGMESSLFLALLILTWGAWLRVEQGDPPRPRDAWILGGCCAALFLGRLEGAVAVPAALMLGWGRIWRAPHPVRTLAGLLAPPFVVGAAYTIWNRLAFQTWLPISGKVKMTWVSRLDPDWRVLGLLDVPWVGRQILERFYGGFAPPRGWLIASGLVFVALLGLGMVFHVPVLRRVREARAMFIIVTVGAIFLVDHVTIGPFLGEWSLVPLHLLTVLALALAAARIRAAAAVLVVAAALLCVARIPIQVWRGHGWADTFTGRSLALAGWIREHTPAEARVGSLYAGVLGYFSGRTVVNLDGLVNSIDYHRRVQIGSEWDSYLRSERIGWLADVGCADEPPMPSLPVFIGKAIGNPDCYAMVHLVRDPGRLPQECGLVLWAIDQEDCPPGAGTPLHRGP